MKRQHALGVFLLAAFAASCFAADAPAPVAKVDKVLILKKDRKLILLSGETEVRRYSVALGLNPVGPKQQRGDNRTPEGFYKIDSRNPNSQYHKSLHISYPNAADRARAKKLGKDPGGDICIHGLPKGQGWIGKAQSLHDWTWGCIALSDEEIDEVWKLVSNGTVVEIRP